MVTIESLNVGFGDKEMHIEDTTPKDRDSLAEEVMGLMKKGFLLFLIQGQESRQIKGYDKDSHQWLLLSDPKTSPKRTSAKDSKVTAVGATAGG